MKKLFIQIAILILISGYLHAELEKGRFKLQYNNNGIISEIYCFVPEDYDSTKSYPFIWGWHGTGMPGMVMRDALDIVFTEKFNAIICCPDFNNLYGEPFQLLINLANESYNVITNNYNINNDKIVITGFSYGGRIAWIEQPSSCKRDCWVSTNNWNF